MPASAKVRVTPVSLLQLILAQGFPIPCPEYPFLHSRKWRFDFAWPVYWVAFEREGNTWVQAKSRHTTGQGYRDDVEKYNEAAILPWCVIRATADMIQDGSAWTTLERALVSKGWRR